MPVKSPVKPSIEVEEMTLPRESTASALIDKIPVGLVLSLASPYLAGQYPDDAIELAHRIYQSEGYTSTLDILGEDMDSDATCDASVQQYKDLADAITKNPLNVQERRKQLTISLKPSMFSTMAPGQANSTAALALAFERIKAVTAYAKDQNINVTLEAEDHRWTDFQLESYFKLIEAGYTNLGTVLQSRLFRTRDDIKGFDDRMRTRLVIGIYNEPSSIAHVDKAIMKSELVTCAQELLKKGVYVEIATHDLNCINSFINDVVIPQNIAFDRFEFQFLHGVPRDDLQRGLHQGSYPNSSTIEQTEKSGMLVRKYLPFGKDNVAGAYCRRRLKENPNMISYGIKNFFRLQ